MMTRDTKKTQKRQAGSSAWQPRSCSAAAASLQGLSVPPLSSPWAPTIPSGLKYPRLAATRGIAPISNFHLLPLCLEHSSCHLSSLPNVMQKWHVPEAFIRPPQAGIKSASLMLPERVVFSRTFGHHHWRGWEPLAFRDSFPPPSLMSGTQESSPHPMYGVELQLLN